MQRTKIWVHAVMIFVLGFGLRVWNMAKEPPGFEEMAATLVATRPISNYLGSYAGSVDFAPPAYYALLHPLAWFGPEPHRLRFLSILLGTATAMLVAVAGRRMLGGRPATIAGYLLALHPLHIFYSQEIQSAALLSLLSLLAFNYMIRSAETNHTRHWVIFDLLAIGVIHTAREAVYLVATFLLVHLARALFFPLTDGQRKLRRSRLLQAVVYNYAIIVLCSVPWMIVMPRGVPWDVDKPGLNDLLLIPDALWIFGKAVWPTGGLRWLAPLLYLLLLPPLWKSFKQINLRWFAVGVCLIGAVALPFGNSVLDKPRFDSSREAMTALPFAVLAMAALISRCNLHVRTLILPLFGLTFALAAIKQAQTTQKPPYFDMALALRARTGPGDVVAFWPNYAATLGHYSRILHGTGYRIETAEDILTKWAQIPPDQPIHFVVAQFPEDSPLMYTFRGALEKYASPTEDSIALWESPQSYNAVFRVQNPDRTALRQWFEDPHSLEIVDVPTSDTFFHFNPPDDVFAGPQFHRDRLDASYDRIGRRVVWTASSKIDLQLPVTLHAGQYALRIHASPIFDPPVALVSPDPKVARYSHERSVNLTLRAFEQRQLRLDSEQIISLNFVTDVELRQVPVHIAVHPVIKLNDANDSTFGLKIYSISIDPIRPPGSSR